MRRLRGDVGAIAPAVPILAFVLLLLGGLVIDASRLLNARGRAVAFAEEAARAGASAVEPGRSELALDRDTVAERVDAYCDAVEQGDGGVSSCDLHAVQAVGGGDRRELVVVVQVGLEIPASLLGMVGVEVLRASARGSARPYEGVDPRDVDSSPPPVEVDPQGPGEDDPPPGVDLEVEVPVPSPSPLPSPSPGATPTVTTSPSAAPSPAGSP